MTTGTVVDLSASTNGRPILIAATTSGGATDLHVATSATDTYDEVTLWASNTDTTDRKLTLQVGGTGAGDTIEQTIPAEGGATLIYHGRIHGGITLEAFCVTANVVNVWGTVNRLLSA